MANPTYAAIDVGTTKVCTVVGEVTPAQELRILGVGIGPSAGLSKGMVDNIQAAIEAISSSVERAERASGTRIVSAHVGIAGPHVSSMNSRGIVAIADPRNPIQESDVQRSLESARIVNVPTNREVIHVVPRYYVVDGQDNVVDPVGMFGSRLDVETHVVTASTSAMNNLVQCVEGAGVRVDGLILEPLASAEAVVEREEMDHGAVICDIGGGTTDIAVFERGAVTHTAVLPIGGLKEKMIAAHRGGVDTVIIPKDNEKDIKDLPAIIKKAITIVPVEHVDEVLARALAVPDPGNFLSDEVHEIDDIYIVPRTPKSTEVAHPAGVN